MIDRYNVLVLIFVRNPFKLLVLKRADFPVGVFQPVSGGVELGEEHIETVVREVYEETLISDYLNIYDLDYSFTFEVNGEMGKRKMKDTCFAMEVKDELRITISEEHSEYEWCNIDKAMELLTFEENKIVLTKLLNIIKS
ncbi:MAG: dihydroneopterin triphosphate pyrophosphatase [Candidatus Izimaplasma bacterium HR2]|nr:MAG: dihydroneopterin triphosphate pyrophosphatase [Candidatus Izimaplasma bacterium HR2]